MILSAENPCAGGCCLVPGRAAFLAPRERGVGRRREEQSPGRGLPGTPGSATWSGSGSRRERAALTTKTQPPWLVVVLEPLPALASPAVKWVALHPRCRSFRAEAPWSGAPRSHKPKAERASAPFLPPSQDAAGVSFLLCTLIRKPVPRALHTPTCPILRGPRMWPPPKGEGRTAQRGPVPRLRSHSPRRTQAARPTPLRLATDPSLLRLHSSFLQKLIFQNRIFLLGFDFVLNLAPRIWISWPSSEKQPQGTRAPRGQVQVAQACPVLHRFVPPRLSEALTKTQRANPSTAPRRPLSPVHLHSFP